MTYYSMAFWVHFSEDSDDSSDSNEKPKLEKRRAKLISPQLLACKMETVNRVEMPPALRQRSIQLQALNANRSSAELLSPQSLTYQSVENDLRQRKKAIVVEDINSVRAKGGTSSSSAAHSSDDECGADESAKFETHLVIEFSPNIQKKTLHWLIDRIRTKVTRGGAGLNVRREPQIK